MTRNDILSQVRVNERGCWIWQGRISNEGYGTLGSKFIHIESYKLFKGWLTDGAQIDHVCNVKACCNPSHLRELSRIANWRRQYARKHGQMSERHRRVAAWLHGEVGKRA